MEGLGSVLGDIAMQAVSRKLKLLELKHPLELHAKLFSIFGKSGTLMIELRILNFLCLKLDGNFDIDRRNNDELLERNWKLARRALEQCRMK